MSERELEDRVVETVKATGSTVVTKGLDVKEYRDKSDASEEEKEKAVEENVIGEIETESSDDSDGVGDDDVRSD